LTPATPRDDAIVFDLLYASRLLTEAIAKGSDAVLNRLRADALNALSATAPGSLARVVTTATADERRKT
jgi:hypothetical protein